MSGVPPMPVGHRSSTIGRMRRTRLAPFRSLVPIAGAFLSIATLTGCGASGPTVEASRSDRTAAAESTLVPTPSTADPTASTVLPGAPTVVTSVPPADADTTTTSTTLVGPDLPSTTVPARRLYEVTGVIGVFPVSGTICALDTTGAAGSLVAPEGSTFDEPDVGTISYGGEVTFAATSGNEGTYTYSIEAYATSFTGYGTYRIGWLNGGQSGGMDLYETSGHASNPVVDQDDTSDQDLAFSDVAIGSC